MGHRLSRSLGPARHLDPGMWSSETASGHPAVSCPKCGEIDELAEHAVDKGGRVTPRWECSECHFEDYLTLENWADEAIA